MGEGKGGDKINIVKIVSLFYCWGLVNKKGIFPKKDPIKPYFLKKVLNFSKVNPAQDAL